MFKKIAATAVITFAVLVAGQQARAADSSGTLVVRGSVETNCTVSIEDMGAQLDLTKGVNNVVVGKVTETCNDPDGYTVTFTSQGGGKLLNNGAAIAYTASYDNRNHQSLASELRLSRRDAAFGVVKDLKVSVDGGSDRIAGAYSDTITVTIAAN
jgi:spore coat protein U-like protein